MIHGAQCNAHRAVWWRIEGGCDGMVQSTINEALRCRAKKASKLACCVLAPINEGGAVGVLLVQHDDGQLLWRVGNLVEQVECHGLMWLVCTEPPDLLGK